MTNRELVIDLVTKLPAGTSLKTIVRKIEFIAGIKQGLAEAKRGEGVSIEEARRLVKSWTTDKLCHPERSEAKSPSRRKARPERSRRT